MTWISAPTTHTARTAKACHWCGEQIEQGQLFVQWCGTTDGEFWVINVHPECHAAWQTLPPDERHEVYQGEFSRGCKCEQGHCRCERKGHAMTEPEARYLQLVDKVNNSRTRDEHYQWHERLVGFLEGVTACGGNAGHLIAYGDNVQRGRGVNRDMCGGVLARLGTADRH